MSNLSSGNQAGPGAFTCASCDSRITLETQAPLPTCGSCGGTNWLPATGGRPDHDPKPIGSI